MYNLLLYKVYIYFVIWELQLLNKQNHSTDKGENFCLFRAFFGCIDLLKTTTFSNKKKKTHTCCKYPWVWRSKIVRPSFRSIFLTHLIACACGSTINGQREPRVTMTPFSVLNKSVGRPWIFHSRTWVGLDKNKLKLKSGVHGIASLLTCGSHTLPKIRPEKIS